MKIPQLCALQHTVDSDPALPPLRRSERCLDIPKFLLREEEKYSSTSPEYNYTKVKKKVKIETSYTHFGDFSPYRKWFYLSPWGKDWGKCRRVLRSPPFS